MIYDDFFKVLGLSSQSPLRLLTYALIFSFNAKGQPAKFSLGYITTRFHCAQQSALNAVNWLTKNGYINKQSDLNGGKNTYSISVDFLQSKGAFALSDLILKPATGDGSQGVPSAGWLANQLSPKNPLKAPNVPEIPANASDSEKKKISDEFNKKMGEYRAGQIDYRIPLRSIRGVFPKAYPHFFTYLYFYHGAGAGTIYIDGKMLNEKDKRELIEWENCNYENYKLNIPFKWKLAPYSLS